MCKTIEEQVVEALAGRPLESRAVRAAVSAGLFRSEWIRDTSRRTTTFRLEVNMTDAFIRSVK